MNVDFTQEGRTLIVKLDGDIDHHTSEEIRRKIEKEFSKRGVQHINFDFTKVSFMDSSGIGMIIGRYKAVDKLGGQVVVSNINDSVYRLFEMSGLHKIINTFDSTDMALKSLTKE